MDASTYPITSGFFFHVSMPAISNVSAVLSSPSSPPTWIMATDARLVPLSPVLPSLNVNFIPFILSSNQQVTIIVVCCSTLFLTIVHTHALCLTGPFTGSYCHAYTPKPLLFPDCPPVSPLSKVHLPGLTQTTLSMKPSQITQLKMISLNILSALMQ